MEYDNLELDTLGEKKTALFVIISNTDAHSILWCNDVFVALSLTL